MSGEAMRRTFAGSAAACASPRAIAATTNATATRRRSHGLVIGSARSNDRNWRRFARGIADHEVEVAARVSLQYMIEVKAPISRRAGVRWGQSQPCSSAIELVGRNAELERASVDVETDRIAGLDERERAADRRFRSDVQHDRAE